MVHLTSNAAVAALAFAAAMADAVVPARAAPKLDDGFGNFQARTGFETGAAEPVSFNGPTEDWGDA